MYHPEYKHFARNGECRDEGWMKEQFQTIIHSNPVIYKGGGSNGAASSFVKENDGIFSWGWGEDSMFFYTSSYESKATTSA